MQHKGSIIRASLRLTVLLMHMLRGLWLVVVYRRRFGRDWYDGKRGKLLIQSWSQRACQILAINMTVTGKISSRHNTLFVANHISWLDIIALSSVLMTKFVSKDTVRRWPVVGQLAVTTGTLFIERGKSFPVKKVIKKIRQKLDGHHSVVIFPEGTTTDGLQLGHFHQALFKSVSDSRHFVQAVALRYTRDGCHDQSAPYIGDDNFIGHLFRMASLKQTCLEMTFTEPFVVADMGRDDITRTVRSQLMESLRDLPSAQIISVAGLAA